MALALVITARKLRPYFLSYHVGIRTNTLLKQVLGKPEASGRLVKWAIELSEYDISYLPRTTIKAQALADFVSKMTGTPLGRGFKTKTLATSRRRGIHYARKWSGSSSYHSLRGGYGIYEKN
ncbi:UNVERIFIED_CONTAM: hypothetical protein Slati_0901400 [Sesamum latifolium]|uniref:Uncharacterized protein n=1 Tax=Sesamum latifolium TaxID=2727402 RepID=A0AAW2XNA6_9LAMI